MTPRWRSTSVFAPPSRQLSTRHERDSLRARVRSFFHPPENGANGEPLHRRRLRVAVLVLYLGVLLSGALAYNLPLAGRQAEIRAQAEREALRIAGMQQLSHELDQERLRHAELLAQREARYRVLPGEADLPVALEELRQLSALSGGLARGVEYSEPRWTATSGVLETHVSFSGTWPEALAYLAALQGLLPELAFERLSFRLDGPGRVTADLLLSAAVLRERPDGAPAWDAAAAWGRAQTAAWEAVPAGTPFTPSAAVWQEGYAAGMGLPQLRLAGVARRGDGEAMALVVYGSETRLVRPGQRVGEIEVVAVDGDGVVISIAGRTYRLQVGQPPVSL